MGIIRLIAIAVVDYDQISIAVDIPTGPGHSSGIGCNDGGAFRCTYIDRLVGGPINLGYAAV
jgi:hypothetical protein